MDIFVTCLLQLRYNVYVSDISALKQLDTIYKYIEANGLSEDFLQSVRSCSSSSIVNSGKNCSDDLQEPICYQYYQRKRNEKEKRQIKMACSEQEHLASVQYVINKKLEMNSLEM